MILHFSFISHRAICDGPARRHPGCEKPRPVCSFPTTHANLEQVTSPTLSLKAHYLQHGRRESRRLSAAERQMLQSDALSV